MRITDYMVNALCNQGVSHVFIDLGGLNDNFMPPLTSTKGLRTVVAAFEGGAAYMADGYSRASGGLGVCFGIGGPGVLNMTTALAAASTDRSSVLAISGEVSRSWEGMGGFQDASHAGIDDIDILQRVTGLSLSMSSAAVVPRHLRHAINYAFTRRSPVHLSVPVDVQKAEIGEEWRTIPTSLLAAKFIDEQALAAAVGLLNNSETRNIIVLAGQGVKRTRPGHASPVRRAVRCPGGDHAIGQGCDAGRSSAGTRCVRLWGIAVGDRCNPLRRGGGSARYRLRFVTTRHNAMGSKNASRPRR